MSRKSNVNHIPYMELNCPFVCYVLGFIWADGYLLNNTNHPYRITVEITNKDFIDIVEVFDKHGIWCKSHRSRANRQPQSSFIVSNKNLYNFLIENDYNNKSFIDPYKIISKIPNELKHYWYRGYFDGDGCFYIHRQLSLYQCNWCSSYEQDWTSISNLLSGLNINYNIKKREQKTSKHSIIRWVGRKQCVRFGDYIYQDYKNIGLTRKYNKYLSMMI